MKDAADAALIADLQLGDIEEVYTLRQSLLISAIFIGFVVLILVIVSIFGFAPQLGRDFYLLPLIIGPILIFISVAWIYQFGSMRLYICTHGLLYLNHKQRRPMRWDEVSQVCQPIGGTSISLTPQYGRQVFFSKPDKPARLYKTFQAKAAQYHFEVTRK